MADGCMLVARRNVRMLVWHTILFFRTPWHDLVGMENVVPSLTIGLNIQRNETAKQSPSGRCSIAAGLCLGGAEVAEADHVRPSMHVRRDPVPT